MTKPVFVYCTTLSSILSLLHILSALRFGMLKLELFKVFSVTYPTKILPAFAWMKEKENYSLVTVEEEFSPSISKMEPKWRNSKKVAKVLTKIKKTFHVCFTTTGANNQISNVIYLQPVGMALFDFSTIVIVQKKGLRNTPWINTQTL